MPLQPPDSGEDPDLPEILDRAYRYAVALAHDRELAADVVQDVCLAIGRRGGPWSLPYMIAAVRNRYLDHRRQVARRPIEALPDVMDRLAAKDALPSTDPGLEAALRSVGSEARELLYLSVVEGYTAAALADMTGRPRGTILSVLHRTKKKLRRLLTEEDLHAL